MNLKILIIALFSIAVVTAGYYFFGNKNQTKNSSPYNTTSSSGGSFLYPFDPSHKSVKDINLVYEFRGKVKDMQPDGSNTKIILDVSDSQTPVFIADNLTNIVKEQAAATAGKIEDLRIGMPVNLYMKYNLQQKNWHLDLIFIYTISQSANP